MPTRFDTVRELIFWEYAKLIARSATGSKEKFGFVQYCFHRLKHGKINPSLILHENKKVVETGDHCAYCGGKHRLHWKQIILRSLGGPDTFDNIVRTCRSCNLSKGRRDPHRWYGLERAHEIPRSCLQNF